MSQDVLWSLNEGIATLSFNRPDKLNAFREETTEQLVSSLERAAADDNVKVIVLTGNGRAFSAGIDLGMIETEPEIQLGQILIEYFEPIFQTLQSIEKPTVAAINGPAAGVSVGIALNCDICVASQSAYLLVPFVGLGLIPDGSLTWMLPRLAGQQVAAGMALLGEKMSAETCEKRGLIWRCYADHEFHEQVISISTKLAQQPALSVALTKQALRSSANNNWQEQLLLERQLQDRCGKTETFKSTRAAFLQ